MNKETHILIVDIDLIDRRDLEGVQGHTFASRQELLDELGLPDEDDERVIIADLDYYIDLVNDQDLDNLEGYWITFVNISI